MIFEERMHRREVAVQILRTALNSLTSEGAEDLSDDNTTSSLVPIRLHHRPMRQDPRPGALRGAPRIPRGRHLNPQDGPQQLDKRRSGRPFRRRHHHSSLVPICLHHWCPRCVTKCAGARILARRPVMQTSRDKGRVVLLSERFASCSPPQIKGKKTGLKPSFCCEIRSHLSRTKTTVYGVITWVRRCCYVNMFLRICFSFADSRNPLV